MTGWCGYSRGVRWLELVRPPVSVPCFGVVLCCGAPCCLVPCIAVLRRVGPRCVAVRPAVPRHVALCRAVVCRSVPRRVAPCCWLLCFGAPCRGLLHCGALRCGVPCLPRRSTWNRRDLHRYCTALERSTSGMATPATDDNVAMSYSALSSKILDAMREVNAAEPPSSHSPADASDWQQLLRQLSRQAKRRSKCFYRRIKTIGLSLPAPSTLLVPKAQDSAHSATELDVEPASNTSHLALTANS